MSNSSIWPIDMTFLGATSQGQSEPGNDGIEGAFRIPQGWSHIIRLFNVIASTLVSGVLLHCKDVVSVLYGPSRQGVIEIYRNVYHQDKIKFASFFLLNCKV